MRKKIIGSLVLGLLFVLHYANENGLQTFMDASGVVTAAVCLSLLLLPLLFCVTIYSDNEMLLFGILAALTIFSFVNVMPFIHSMAYLPVLYLLVFFKLSMKAQKNDAIGKWCLVPLFLTDVLFVVYVLLLIPLKEVDRSVYIALLTIVLALLTYRFVSGFSRADVKRNNVTEVWFHYFGALFIKLYFALQINPAAIVPQNFFQLRIWLFVPDFLFLISFVLMLKEQRKQEIKNLKESKCEN